MSVIPTLDHVVVNARDGLAEAAALWARLGFTLTPRGTHTLGTRNHLAVFGTDYLELVGAPAGRSDLHPMRWPAGLNGLVFGSDDAQRTYDAMKTAGVAADPPLEFSRPVFGGAVAAFRTVNLPDGTIASGRVYFCEHRTRDLVWRDEWRGHANGVIGIEAVTVVARDPAILGGTLAEMFGVHAVRAIPGGLRLACALTRVDVIDLPQFERRWGVTAFALDDRAEAMSALTLRTTSLARAHAALRAGGIEFRDESGRITLDAPQAGGVALGFVE